MLNCAAKGDEYLLGLLSKKPPVDSSLHSVSTVCIFSNLHPVLIPFLFPNVIEFLDADKIHTHGMCMQALRVRRYIPNRFATSALEEDEWSAPRPAKFTSTNTGYRFYRRLGALGTVLEGAEKSCLHWVSIPGPFSPYQVAIAPTLSRPPRL